MPRILRKESNILMTESINTPKLRFALPYAVIGISLAVLSAILRCINLVFFFDSDIGYYQRGAVLPILSVILLAASVVFFAVCSILWFRKSPVTYAKTPSWAVRIGAFVAVAGFIALVAFDILGVVAGAKLSIVNLLFGVLSIAYFVMLALDKGQDGLRVLCGFCVILRLLISLAGSYFNIFIQMNAPDKLFFHLGCLGGMLFLISELRALLANPRPALHLFSCGAATLFLGVASLPSIVAYYSGLLTDDTVLGGYYMLFGLFVYTAIRLLSLALTPIGNEPSTEETTDTPEEPAPIEEVEAPNEEMTESNETEETVTIEERNEDPS